MTENYDDNTPRDIVPRRGITRDLLARLNAATPGQTVVQHEPGEVLTDVDGWPIGVGPMTTTTSVLAGVAIHVNDLPADLGISEARELYPNITIYVPQEQQ